MADKASSPAWGYDKKTGEAVLFPDGVLPKGYVDTPAKCEKSDK